MRCFREFNLIALDKAIKSRGYNVSFSAVARAFSALEFEAQRLKNSDHVASWLVPLSNTTSPFSDHINITVKLRRWISGEAHEIKVMRIFWELEDVKIEEVESNEKI